MWKVGKLELPSLELSDSLETVIGTNVTESDEYVAHLHLAFMDALLYRRPVPIVRFGDGELAFYRSDKYSMMVNGLYAQATSLTEVKNVMPAHIEALQYISKKGILCPLGWLEYEPHWMLKETFDEGHYDFRRLFMTFLESINAPLAHKNYIPFYVIYAYFTSELFMQSIDGKSILIISDDFNDKDIQDWTDQFHVNVRYHHASIPKTLVAVTWPDLRDQVMADIEARVQSRDLEFDLVFVAAGAGAAMVCADMARKFRVPVIDAGHVVNLMNNQIYKSNGHRPYTFRGIR